MNSSTLLRIASIITLLYCVGHSSGAPWTPGRGLGEMAALEAMQLHRFEVLGSSRTYWDFYVGFGAAISVYLLLQAVALWQLAALVKTDAFRLRPIIATFMGAFAVNAIITWKYFFILPAVFSVAIVACLGLALLLLKANK